MPETVIPILRQFSIPAASKALIVFRNSANRDMRLLEIKVANDELEVSFPDFSSDIQEIEGSGLTPSNAITVDGDFRLDFERPGVNLPHDIKVEVENLGILAVVFIVVLVPSNIAPIGVVPEPADTGVVTPPAGPGSRSERGPGPLD